MPPVERLKKRKDFLRISAEGRKFVTSGFILLAAPSTENSEAARFGFTVTKKIGNAPVRNRIRRRLREGVRLSAGEIASPGWDYVLIARINALQCEFSALLRDIRFAVPRVEKAERNTPGIRRAGKKK